MIEVSEVLAHADDRLVVHGTVEGEPVVATGWVSALTQHYGPECYDEDGNLREGASSRKMEPGERRAYCERLLSDASGVEAAPSKVSLSAKRLSL